MLKVYKKPEAEMLDVTVENIMVDTSIPAGGQEATDANERRGDWGSIWNK